MNKPRSAEFDRYAKEYTDLHRASIRASGEEPAYFSRYKAVYMAKWIEKRARERPADVLDFGCGVGNAIPHLRAAFPAARICGADPSGESIQLAVERHAGCAAFHVCGDRELPYADGSFDLVQAACVFHHIKPSLRGLWMQEIRRVMKPRGHLFAFEHNVLNPLTVKAVRDCPFDEGAVLLPKDELLALARAAEFGEIRARYIVFFPKPLGFLRPLESSLGLIPFGAQYVVHAVA